MGYDRVDCNSIKLLHDLTTCSQKCHDPLQETISLWKNLYVSALGLEVVDPQPDEYFLDSVFCPFLFDDDGA